MICNECAQVKPEGVRPCPHCTHRAETLRLLKAMDVRLAAQNGLLRRIAAATEYFVKVIKEEKARGI